MGRKQKTARVAISSDRKYLDMRREGSAGHCNAEIGESGHRGIGTTTFSPLINKDDTDGNRRNRRGRKGNPMSRFPELCPCLRASVVSRFLRFLPREPPARVPHPL